MLLYEHEALGFIDHNSRIEEMQVSERLRVPNLGPVPAEEAAAVKPVGLLPVKEGRLNHGGQPHVTLRDFSFAALALGPPGLRVLRPEQGR